MKYKITYGVGGGYNDINSEIVECASIEEASQWAYDCAVDVFESYGIFDYSEYENEDDEYINEAYFQDVDSWCHYSAEEVTKDV
jgi:hypothetical protein